MSSEQYFLKSHKLTDDEFIGTIQIENTSNGQQNPGLLQTVIILDRSGSMGLAVPRVTNEIIPSFLSKLYYNDNQVIHFITFDTATELFSVSIEDMKTLPIKSRGGTVMAPAVIKCEELFETFDYSKPIRLLTISDGQVHDRANVENASAAFVEFLKNHDFSINSQAVRLFTSASQPDTTALASLLQINNTTTSRLVDISTAETNDSISDKIAVLFKSDNLAFGRTLSAKDKTIVKFPWESKATDKLTLTPGDNLFWLKASPNDEMKLGKSRVNIIEQQPLTLLKFQALMDGKLDYIVDQMRILKVVGTSAAENTVTQMLEYFEQKEDFLMKKSFVVKYLGLDWIHRKKISKVLEVIAKDKNVKTLDPAQKAEYLRQAGFTKENPTAVEKLFEYGIDIDSEESRKMCLILFFIFVAMLFSKIFGN